MEQGTGTHQTGEHPLTNAPAAATISTTDVQRSFDFYTKKVGLKDVHVNEGKEGHGGYFVLEAGGGTTVLVYQRDSPPKAENTAITFLVPGEFKSVVTKLKANGVAFEHYEGEGGVTTNEEGIAEDGDFKSAWFKDPDGNIVAVMKTPPPK